MAENNIRGAQKQAHADSYQQQSTLLYATIRSLKARSHSFVVGEIITFLAVFICLVLSCWQGSVKVEWLLGALVAAAAYIIIRQIDAHNDKHIEEMQDLKTVYDHELQAIRHDFRCFDDGSRYADAHHAYSFDLDLFGPDSLFQRFCRTATTGGSDRLARRLCCMERMEAKPEELDRLAEDVSFRSLFIAQGVREKIDTGAISQALKTARQLELPTWASSHIALALVLIDILGFWVSILLAAAGRCSAQLPIWWGILQFFVVYAACNGPLRKIASAMDKLHGQVQRFERLATIIDEREAKKENRQYKGEVIFHALSNFIDALDRRGNILGLFLINTFFLSDFFTIRKFLKWKTNDSKAMDDYIRHVVQLDEEVTVATLRYNLPETTWPTINSGNGVSIIAQGLWHPFLDATAVRNDFRVDDRNFYIITGANMAGKSTFLRAVGVNCVLALSGMPVFAEQFTLNRFRLFTSMRTSDDLSHGISYFNAELLRLRQLIEAIQGANTLIILDEILKGTNSADKLNGSRMFLEYMSHEPVAGIIATHDLKLSEMADEHPEHFHNFCFEIQLGTRVTYSYKITPGIAKNQNATFLLQQILSGIDKKKEK